MYPQVRFYLDGYLRIHSYLIYLPEIDTVHIGFFGSSGRCHAGNYIDNVLVRRPRFTVTDESEFEATGILDTRPPAVALACPDPTEAGDTGEFTWAVEDSFPGFGGICSLFVQYPTFTDTLLTMADNIETALFPSCTPVIATVSVPDSFCNRGRTSCAFTTCDSPAGFVVCGPSDSYSSCTGQPVTFGIYDTLCDNIVDTVWATVNMPGPDIHLMTGDAEFVTWTVAETTFVTIGGWSASDMESVTVSIDSVQYDNGCTATRR